MSSQYAGSAREDLVIIDFIWIQNLRPAFIILPDAMNSVLILYAPEVLFTELCARRVFAVEIWRGRQNSESAVESETVNC